MGEETNQGVASKFELISNSIAQIQSPSNLHFCITIQVEYKRKYEIQNQVAYKTVRCDPRLHELIGIPN